MSSDSARRSLLGTLATPNASKLVLLVLDGLGGLAGSGGATELETALTPNLDGLATRGTLGLLTPVSPGITPGSGPAHLGLFGFDPLEVVVGRGVLEALGVGFPLRPTDVAARCNFCTLDADGLILDRRAHRIASDVAAPLAERLQAIDVPGTEIFVRHVKDYRFALVLRGEGLAADVADTDPQSEGFAPLAAQPLSQASRHTAAAIDRFVRQAREILSGCVANGVLVRGVSQQPDIPTFEAAYHLRSLAVAVYPMYRGLARLVGMDIATVANLDEQIATVAASWDHYDFFFVHYKPTDAAGEDGDFAQKVAAIEALDQALPRLLAPGPDVLAVTGDHSTPSVVKGHSWHPVPLLLAADACRTDVHRSFGEDTCHTGGLGHIESRHLLALMLAHAGRLSKYGA